MAFALVLGLALVSSGRSAEATPVAANAAAYQACGRVFPDPHAYWPSTTPPKGQSPFAKGNLECRASDFLQYQEMVDGMTYLEDLFPNFLKFEKLEKEANCSASVDADDKCSAGLPRQGFPGAQRIKSDLYMIRVTDERVPNKGKKYFAFPLSIHGIERAGAEAGVRASEDLATWAYCEAIGKNEPIQPNALVDCTNEGDMPHPLLETTPKQSVTAGDALKRSVIYFVFPNPDGWRRGDRDNFASFYQRYNGNGVDLNRDWPTIGYTFRPYTPWSEPETKWFGKELQRIGPKDENGNPKWTGGIDLHGQLIDRAFSFTLMGASERNYAKNQRILQTVKGAWRDAENRLGWSPLIKPNEAPEGDPRVYGVQWGTVWDTIDYTVTGSLGDWIDSPLGLNADGIDNEMSLSHLSNCVTGSCFLPDAEQLHVDGNKSLVYSMVNFSLLPEDQRFRAPGKVGYVFDPTVISNKGELETPPPTEGLDPQEDILDASLDPSNKYIYQFDVKGLDDGVYNGGLVGTATPSNQIQGVSGESLTNLVLERYRGDEEDPPQGGADDEGCGVEGEKRDVWQEVNRYFNQSSIYLQSGQAVHANSPSPGPWRICLTGGLTSKTITNGQVDLDISFLPEQAIELPEGGQAPYKVSNMKFFEDIAPHMRAGQLTPVRADGILSGKVKLSRFRSLVIADDALPGYVEPIPTGPAQEKKRVENPGEGATPCGAVTQDPPCSKEHPFEVKAGFNNQKVTVTLETPETGVNDWDLYVQRKSQISGEWSEVGSSATAAGDEQVTLLTPPVGEYRAQVVNYSGTATSYLEIAFSNEYTGPPVAKSRRSNAERDRWGQKLRAFVEQGGNLVLTDGAIKNLAYMDVVPRDYISSFSVYAGFIGFTCGRDDCGGDGDDVTYEDPLAKNVNQPGAAEGPNHRHQTYEPVPIGFAIQNESGANFNGSPVWAVDQAQWEKKSSPRGRTVGITSADQVSLGEKRLGKGVIRIIGPLLPMPTEQYYHPFGLANYSLTYSGYQVLNNALQWTRPKVEPPKDDDKKPEPKDDDKKEPKDDDDDGDPEERDPTEPDVGSETEEEGGGLPFSGSDLLGLVALGFALSGAGWALYRRTRRHRTG